MWRSLSGGGWLGILKILDAGSAGVGLCGRPMGIRQDGLYGHHQVAAMGVVGALCLCGSDRPIGSRGKAYGVTWWVGTMGVCGVLDQGRRGVAEEKPGLIRSDGLRIGDTAISPNPSAKKNPTPVGHGIKDTIYAMDQGGSNIASGGR